MGRRAKGFALVVAAALAAHACASRMGRAGSSAMLLRTVRVQVAGAVVRVPLEEYVRVTVLSEFGRRSGDPDAIRRMLETQAIVSRTYALSPRHVSEGFDFCSTTHCQIYDPARATESAWTATVSEAVRGTDGATVWFGQAPARVVYHADCGGHTSAARDVWRGDDLPYLAAVADAGPADAAHAAWTFAPVRSELIAALNADGRTRVGSRLHRIDVLRRDDAGRAELVGLDGERSPVVRGEELRLVLARRFGARALRSTRFDVVRAERGFEFTGRGFGHGVGLCQAGAFARITAGASPEQVLAHYFPGTSLR